MAIDLFVANHSAIFPFLGGAGQPSNLSLLGKHHRSPDQGVRIGLKSCKKERRADTSGLGSLLKFAVGQTTTKNFMGVRRRWLWQHSLVQVSGITYPYAPFGQVTVLLWVTVQPISKLKTKLLVRNWNRDEWVSAARTRISDLPSPSLLVISLHEKFITDISLFFSKPNLLSSDPFTGRKFQSFPFFVSIFISCFATDTILAWFKNGSKSNRILGFFSWTWPTSTDVFTSEWQKRSSIYLSRCPIRWRQT